MKKGLFVLFMIIGVAASAQRFELSGRYLYTFQNKINVWDGRIKFDDSDAWAVSATFNLQPTMGVELSWFHQNTTLAYDRYDGTRDQFTNAVIDYYLIGGSKSVEVSETVKPFGGVKLGAVNLNPNQRGVDNATKFAMGLGGGVKVFPTERIGIRIEANLLMPVQYGGLSIFCGTGGCGTGASVSSAIAQFNLGGGLILAIP